MSKIALLPASDSRYDQAWASWEYLGLYRRIVWGGHQSYNANIWMVLNERENTAAELSRLLKGY